jgi:restriction system protein
VKFKMAEKSLFAVLLRSPWWISFLAVGVIVLAAGAFLPPQYFVVGALAGFPIFVVGCMAAWRQLRAPAPQKVAEMQETIASMPWRSFATTLAAAWGRAGYTVERLNDNFSGADLSLQNKGRTTLVSAKRWKAATHGVEPLRELQQAMLARDAQDGIYIAMGGVVSDNAQNFARAHGISVMQGNAVAQLLLTQDS